MSDTIKDGKGKGNLAGVTTDNRLLVDGIVESVGAERSRKGKTFGLGSGGITADSAMSLAPILYFKNSSTDKVLNIRKLIFGWNGGSTNHNRTILAFVKYNSSEPTGAHTLATDAIENIGLSGSTEAVTSGVTTIYQWDGTGTDGMTGMTGGYLQIPNRIAIGNTSLDIDGEIILGPGDSMTFEITPEETGLFHTSVVFYTTEVSKERGEE